MAVRKFELGAVRLNRMHIRLTKDVPSTNHADMPGREVRQHVDLER